MLRAGLIGFGSHAQNVHAPVLTKLAGVSLVAIAESDPERREQARRRVPAAKIFSDYRDLLQASALDAIFICVPPALHAPAAIAAMEKRSAVYVEKPLTLNLRDADAMIQCWRETGVMAMIGFNYRFHPLYQSAKKFLKGDSLGRVTYAHTSFSSRQKTSDWKQTPAAGGSPLLELGSHHIDLVRFLLGQEIVQVFAQTQSVEGEADQTTLEMELANGVRVQSIFSFHSIEEERIEIYGTAGKLTVDRFLNDELEFTNAARDRARYDRAARAVRAFSRSLYNQTFARGPQLDVSYPAAFARFVAAVRGDAGEFPDLEDGLQALRVCGAANLSAQTHHRVTVAEFRDENLARQ